MLVLSRQSHLMLPRYVKKKMLSGTIILSILAERYTFISSLIIFKPLITSLYPTFITSLVLVAILLCFHSIVI